MKIYHSITFKVFALLSLLLAFFMCILIFVQVFIVGRSYSISEFVLERERQLTPIISRFIDKNYMDGGYNGLSASTNTFNLEDMETFEYANNVHLIVFSSDLKSQYMTGSTKKLLDPYYIEDIKDRLPLRQEYYRPDSPVLFRVYNRFGFPTSYVASATPVYRGYDIQYLVTLIPEVFTTRTSGILKGYAVYIFIFLLALILGISALFSYFVTKPVLSISKTASKISELDFSEKCEVKSRDEMGSLANTINNMARKLETTIENLSHANEKLQKDLNLRNELDLLRREFIGAITHEFKTPITLIRGYTESIKDNVGNEQEKEYALNTVIAETENMDKLVRDLLDLSKLESVGYKLNLGEFYIDELLIKIMKKYTNIMEERDIHFVENIESCSLLVVGDPFRIEQVVSNFINNAIENTPPGRNITVTLQDKPGHTLVSVHNEGKNIDENELHRIWEKFYRLEKSRNKKLGGTGLGLAISKSILKLHESDFGVENTNNGVKFFFTLKHA